MPLGACRARPDDRAALCTAANRDRTRCDHRAVRGRSCRRSDRAQPAAGGSELAARFSAAKKGDLAASAERIFAGSFITEAEVKERALGWIPVAMRFAQAPQCDPSENTGASDGVGPTDGPATPDNLAEEAVTGADCPDRMPEPSAESAADDAETQELAA